ncbi:50S ribosomal protein L18 [Methylocystis parvus]|uniref:Large ribosomal subunit protein uL18 n=1 Tax=Methylocystis parvus TaxID=134 RepID=A0A6B8M5H4_9HYPH|nr:50S ribosomal protein L18 [Methylocystis parvus]QGM97678.1 50S ribosomal protein L18 [Methylocystis parvus]WBJ98387.1 50S ribosomal protein L18 [Methylocystis parvus OBBP]
MAKDVSIEQRRKARVRKAIRERAYGRPRLSVFRSSKQIYAQIIDDENGQTLVSASSIEKENRESLKTGANVDAAKVVGKLLAARATAKGVTQVVFDRGAYMYHGRVKALADGAREGGLQF